MFENSQIALIEGKCRSFRNSFDCLDGAKRSVKMWSTTFYKNFFKNISLYMSSRLSIIRSLHTYGMPRTVYFGWICIGAPTEVIFASRLMKCPQEFEQFARKKRWKYKLIRMQWVIWVGHWKDWVPVHDFWFVSQYLHNHFRTCNYNLRRML